MNDLIRQGDLSDFNLYIQVLEHLDFEKYLKDAIGSVYVEKAIDALSDEASVSIRFNPSKLYGADPHDLCGNLSDSVDWSPYGYFLESRPQFTLDPRFHSGQYYVQDSSAMFVGHAFRQILRHYENLGRPLRVLDLCAAPGGKTTDMAASLRENFGDGFLLVANEVMKQRAGILAENAARWGDPNICVTSSDPAAFSKLGGFFDIIVADVPCSGEGMFRKDEEALKQWSLDNVELCRTRQRRIIADVWPALAEGGHLVYSTCTFNRLENDDNVEWIEAGLGAENQEILLDGIGKDSILIRTDKGISLVPGMVRGEGQYCSVMRKTSAADCPKLKAVKLTGKNKFIEDTLEGEYMAYIKGDLITAVPKQLASEMQLVDILHPLLRGTAVGTPKGKDFVPHADLALSIKLKKNAFEVANLDLDMALAYLHKDNILLKDSARGLMLLQYDSLPLGFVKNLGNRCNSLLPQSRRIRMNLNE